MGDQEVVHRNKGHVIAEIVIEIVIVQDLNLLEMIDENTRKDLAVGQEVVVDLQEGNPVKSRMIEVVIVAVEVAMNVIKIDIGIGTEDAINIALHQVSRTHL